MSRQYYRNKTTEELEHLSAQYDRIESDYANRELDRREAAKERQIDRLTNLTCNFLMLVATIVACATAFLLAPTVESWLKQLFH